MRRKLKLCIDRFSGHNAIIGSQTPNSQTGSIRLKTLVVL
jgi:hypothetical protein